MLLLTRDGSTWPARVCAPPFSNLCPKLAKDNSSASMNHKTAISRVVFFNMTEDVLPGLARLCSNP